MNLVDPNELFFRSIVPADLFAKIKDIQILASADLQDACYSYNFVLGTYSKLYVFEIQLSIIFRKAKTSKEDHLCVKTEHSCDVCGISNKISLKSSKKWTFVLCGHKSRSSTRSLESINSDSLSPICGSFMCYTCHSIFGFNSIKYCPIHLTGDAVRRMNLNYHNKTMAKNMSNEVSKYLLSKLDREHFFQPKRHIFLTTPRKTINQSLASIVISIEQHLIYYLSTLHTWIQMCQFKQIVITTPSLLVVWAIWKKSQMIRWPVFFIKIAIMHNISYYITNKTKTQRLSRNHLWRN